MKLYSFFYFLSITVSLVSVSSVLVIGLGETSTSCAEHNLFKSVLLLIILSGVLLSFLFLYIGSKLEITYLRKSIND